MRSQNRRALLDQLQARLRHWERGTGRRQGEISSTGCAALDELLPAGGLRRGTLVEWLSACRGSTAGLLALAAAREAANAGGAILIFDRRRTIYAPALAAWGLDLRRVVFVTADNVADEHWAVDQALRCPGVAAVWSTCEELDSRMFRRWQLAAESSGCLGLLVRSNAAWGQPTWSDMQWQVTPQATEEGRRLYVELLRCRGTRGGAAIDLIMDEATGVLERAEECHETSLVPVAAAACAP